MKILLNLIASLSVLPLAAQTPSVQREIQMAPGMAASDRLQGIWDYEKISDPKMDKNAKKGLRLTISGKTATLHEHNHIYRGTYAIDTTVKPWTIDFHYRTDEGVLSDHFKILSIFKFEDDLLHIARHKELSSVRRPTNFSNNEFATATFRKRPPKEITPQTLAGTWRSDPAKPNPVTMTFQKNKVTTRDGKQTFSGTYVLDTTTTPTRITFLHTREASKTTIKAIIKQQDNTITIARHQNTVAPDHPTSFTTENLQLTTLKKIP